MIYIKQKYLYINNKFKTIVNKIYVILIAKVLYIKFINLKLKIFIKIYFKNHFFQFFYIFKQKIYNQNYNFHNF